MSFLSDVSFLHYLVIASLACVSLSAFISYQFFSRLRRAHSADIEKLQLNLNVLTSGSHGMGQKLLLLEKKIKSLESSQDEIKVSNMEFSYTTAQKLIAEGIDDRSIAANSGLSTTEINLMRLLQGQEQPSYENHV